MGLIVFLMPAANTSMVMYATFMLFGVSESMLSSSVASWIAEQFNERNLLIIRLSYRYSIIGAGSDIGPVVA